MYAAYRALAQDQVWAALRLVARAVLLDPMSLFSYFGRRVGLRLLMGERWAERREQWLHREAEWRARQYWGQEADGPSAAQGGL